MEGSKSFRDGKRTIRMNTNRREDICMQQELDDVNVKTIADINSKRLLKKLEPLTDDELYLRSMQAQFIPEPPKKERKSQPVYHENIKTKDVKPDQYLVMPSIPAYSPVDTGAKVVLNSRSRKFPYVKKQLTTTEDMKKPRVSTLGVLPVRESLEIPELRVVLEGDPAPVDTESTHARPKLYNTPATSFFVPKLQLQEESGDESSQKTKENASEKTKRELDDKEGKEADIPLKKPAILPGVGTTTSVHFSERVKPASKPSYLFSLRKKSAKSLMRDTSRADTAQSFQSSLMSGEITLPDEAIFSRYDEAIEHINNDYGPDDVETAVGAMAKSRASVQSMDGSIKSVKELLDEAKRISRSDSDPLYKRGEGDTEKKSEMDTLTVTDKKSGRKSAKSSRSSKSAKSSKDGKTRDRKKSAVEAIEKKREERTVDEIIASLKDQSAYNIETEADRKIKEIMNRVISRSTAVLDSNLEETEDNPESAVDEDEMSLAQDGAIASDHEGGADDLQTQDSPREASIGDATDTFKQSMTDMTLPQDQIVEESEGEGMSMTTRTTETISAVLQAAEDATDGEGIEEGDDDDEEEANMLMPWDIQQAWEDLLSPPEASAEDILSVHGQIKDMHEKTVPVPDTKSKPNIHAPSLSFLSSWAPAGAKRETPVVKKGKQFAPNNIHHFCKMTTEFQLPEELMNVGRKYHHPDKYASVMPQQPYRFKPGEPIHEERASTADTETRIEIAAQRVITEANQVVGEDNLTDWQGKAEKMLGDLDMTLAGDAVQIKSDESQVYWNPAPPKLGAASFKVRELLFTQYNVEELDEFGRVKAPVKVDEESDSSEEEEPEAISKDHLEAIQRTVLKRHNSAETLTLYSRERMKINFPEETPDDDQIDETLAEGMPYDVDLAGLEGRDDQESTTITATDRGGAVDREDTLDTQGNFEAEFQSQQVAKKKREEKQERPGTAPNLKFDDDDTLIVPQDFNSAMHEISEQKGLLEKAKKQMRVQEAFDELEKLEQEEREKKEQDEPTPVTENAEEEFMMEPVANVEEELTPAEQALKAGRNYVILPKKKKKKKGGRPLDMARIEAAEKFLVSKPMVKLTRHESMPKLHRALERDLRVPWHIRTHQSSIPDLLNFDEYKTRKRMPKNDDEREWVRGIWNTWFDQVFPPTPDVSDGEEEAEVEGEDKEEKKEKKSKKDPISDILSQDVEAIAPIMDTPENSEIYHILTEEIDKLTQMIDMKHNKNAFDFCRRGALLRKIGLLKKAEEDLDRAINMEPELLDAYWHRHLLYILQDRKSAALDDLNFIMKKNKNHAGAYRSMAEIYKRQGDITMAIINYSSAIKFNPVDHEAYYQRAGLYEERGEMLLAMEDYTKAMKISPQRTDAIMKHGMYYFENETWQNAINDFTELLKVDPLNATARLFRGRAYAKMNSWVPAVEDLSAAIHLDPYNWQAFYQRACILRKAHPKRALQDYSVSLLLNDTEENVMSYLHRGILYDTLGKPEDSIPDFESVLKLNKDIAAAHVNLGLIYMMKHLNYHRAIKKFSSAIKVDPTYVRAYVCRAEAYHKIHETKNALKDYTRAIHLRPDIHHYYMFRGQLVLEMGNLDLAAFCVRHASELGMDSPTSTFGGSPTQQAVVQSFLKNYDKAIDALVQASRLKPIAPYFMMLGKTNMKAKQFKDAVTSFKAALEKMRPWRKRDPWPPETADAHYLSGLCHMELRNYSEALLQFNFAIKFNPSHADAYYQRGLAAVKMRQMKGIQDFNRALAINAKIFQAYLSRACYYGMKGKYAKAILNCNEAIKLQPKSVRAFLYRGSLKYHIKAYELAILDLSKAAAIDTQCPLPFFNRAVCYHENGQYDKALTDYGIVLLLGSMLSLKVLINRGLLYFERQDYMNALFDFQAAAKLSSKDHRIHHTLGLCFHKLKEAVATFTHCLQLKPYFLDGIIARGNVFMDYGHERGLEFARRDYQRALRLDPLCLPARINLAYTAQVSGKLMQAWKHFTAVIEVKPNYKPALEGRAIINLQMSSTFAAYQDISRSINCGATAELLTNRGVINQFMGDPVMAMQDYQRAIKLDPTYALAYFNAGNVYFHTRHFKQALEYYKKAAEYNPQDESTFLNRAITKVLLHDTQGALADFKIAAKLSPYSAHIYFNRANVYASLQQFDKAEKEYTKALELQPDDPLMLKRRADVRGKLGKQTEAIDDYKRAVHIQSRPNKVVKKS